MTIHKGQIDADSELLTKVVVLGVQTVGNSEADTLFDAFAPSFPYRIERVEHFAEAVTATATYDVQIAKAGGNVDVVAAEAPTAATREDATIDGSEDDRTGAAEEAIELRADTDVGGDLTGLKVKVVIRPHPAGGEAGA